MAQHPSTGRGEASITLRQAAVVAGVGLLIMVVTGPFAEFYVYPKIIVAGDAASTIRNILTDEGLFIAGIFAHLVTYVSDVLVAWALYILLTPVSRALSLLAAWLRLVYTVLVMSALFNLMTTFRLVKTAAASTATATGERAAQIDLLVSTFRYETNLALVLFGIHLVLLGVLVFRSGYIPRTLGALLATAGFGYIIYYLEPYLYPGANLRFVMVAFFAELIFMVWLLVRGWRIAEAPRAAPPST